MTGFRGIVELLKKMTNPQAAWLAIEVELLQENTDVFLIAGAVLETIPVQVKGYDHFIRDIKELADKALEMYQEYGSADSFNSDRLRLRSAIYGLLSSPKSV